MSADRVFFERIGLVFGSVTAVVMMVALIVVIVHLNGGSTFAEALDRNIVRRLT